MTDDDDIDPSVASVASVGHTGRRNYSAAVAACLNASRLGLSNITQQRVKRLRSRHSFTPPDCSWGKRPAVHSVAKRAPI